MRPAFKALAAVAFAVALSGCSATASSLWQNDVVRGATYGAGTGAVMGAAVGGVTAPAGAVVGAAAGAVVAVTDDD